MEPPAWLDWAADIGQLLDIAVFTVPTIIAGVALWKVRRLERREKS